MAISTAMSTSFKEESWQEGHTFGDAGTSPVGGDTFKLALIKATPIGTYDATSTNYSDITGNTDEAVDAASPQGYTAGGGILESQGVAVTSTTAWVDFADLTFTAVDLSADGCMIYNTSNANASVSVHDFSGTKTASGGDFVIQFPAADSTNAILKIGLMIYDEADAQITDILTGRTIDHVIRNGKVIEIICTDGHVVKLQSDIDHDIQLNGVDVRVVVPGVSLNGQAGRF